MKIKAIIFDMDGVLFDSEQATLRIWQELSDRYGFSNLENVYWQCIGVNSITTKQIFLDFYGSSFPYDKYKEEQREIYLARYRGGRLPLKCGVKELLEDLSQENYKLAIASSTPTPIVEEQIQEARLRRYFHLIVGGEQVSKSKPDPEIFLKTASILEVEPKETVVIEDSYNGIRAAYEGGFIPVMIPDILKPDLEMRKKAKLILADLYQLRTYFKTGFLSQIR